MSNYSYILDGIFNCRKSSGY